MRRTVKMTKPLVIQIPPTLNKLREQSKKCQTCCCGLHVWPTAPQAMSQCDDNSFFIAIIEVHVLWCRRIYYNFFLLFKNLFKNIFIKTMPRKYREFSNGFLLLFIFSYKFNEGLQFSFISKIWITLTSHSDQQQHLWAETDFSRQPCRSCRLCPSSVSFHHLHCSRGPSFQSSPQPDPWFPWLRREASGRRENKLHEEASNF